MAAGKLHLELYVERAWVIAAEVRCDDVNGGVRSATRLEYDFDYLASTGELDVRDLRAVSCRYPVGYGVHAEETWPAFLLDVIPSGAARRFWEGQLGLPNVPASDWAILTAGGGNPPGNLRVHEAVELSREQTAHPGFTREEVLDRAEGFIEYARAKGASVAGGSGAAGDAPKFLLREDVSGRWHADGALPDERTARSWIVKFPRSPRTPDRLVLETECPYYRLAARLGARVEGPLSWERDALFIPRFDRPVRPDGSIARLGMESLCSLAGVSEFGAPTPKETLARALARFATDPGRELRELLLRDVLDVALGNTDNHARNTAILKREDGTVELTPLYDFAPMVLDPQGIARVCRWNPDAEVDGFPQWARVIETLAPLGLDSGPTKTWLRELADVVAELPASMSGEGVDDGIIETLRSRIARTARSLAETR